MKKQLHIKPILSLLFLFVVSISLRAQQFEWAKSYSGQDGMNNTDKYNRIYNSAFDSQGNIYIVGTMGENAIIDTTHLSEGFLENKAAIILAKLDPQGNLLWHKSIKNTQDSRNPCWIQIVGDTSIALLANIWAIGGNLGNNLWYLDTLLVGSNSNPPQYPMPSGYYNCFVTFDLNGNKTSEHFLQMQQLKNDGTLTAQKSFADNMRVAPFYIDKNGYIYIYSIIYKESNSDSIKLVVDRQKTFACGEFVENFYINTWAFKFTPDFDLVWAKKVIRDTSGVGIDFAINSFNPFITGISADSEDNMYLTGYIERYRSNTEDTTFYRNIELGNNKKLIINDAGCANLGFLIKYDTTGEPQWANQLYGKKNFNGSGAFPQYSSNIYNSTINEDNNSIYIIGSAVYDTTYCKLYFDDSTQFVFDPSHLIYSRTSGSSGAVFFAKLNKETGKYINHGTAISSQGTFFTGTGTYNVSLATRNNQVFSQVFYYRDLVGVDTVFTTGGMTSPSIGLMRWKDDGEVIDVINIPTNGSSSYTQACNTILNDNGDLFITGMFDNTISFGDITLIGSSGRSNAFMAKYHDSTFVHPYTESSIRDIPLINEKGIIVYPNPTKGDVNITTQGEKINSYSLYNVNGQLLLKSEKLKTMSEKINLSGFSKGVYIIKIITNKNVYSKKIIVN